MPVLSCAFLLMWPLLDPTTIGRAIRPGAGALAWDPIAFESRGRARPAATAAPAPRNSRRVVAITAPRLRRGMRIILCPPMPASVREQLRQAHFLENVNESAMHQLSKLVEPKTFETDAILFSE